ncbi:hypothetical protein [Xylella fastidiosa]|nr:hypothetical protein [Xylella fastidiosa]WGZ34910.1 hypothetical protein O4445_03165 [Xylella fastidiosa subsp. pauca]
MLPGPAVAGPGVLRRCMARWRYQEINVADEVGYGMRLPCTPHDVLGCSSGIIFDLNHIFYQAAIMYRQRRAVVLQAFEDAGTALRCHAKVLLATGSAIPPSLVKD